MLIRKRWAFVLFSLVLMLQLTIACSSALQSIQGERWVVLSAEQAREQGLSDWLVTNNQTADYWTPSESDVDALEHGLVPYLQSNPESFYEGTRVSERLDEYNRQYIGLTLDGKKIIYGNYFCDSIETDWRKDFVFVMDGGDCFFQFKYDVDAAEFFDLQVNGVA